MRTEPTSGAVRTACDVLAGITDAMVLSDADLQHALATLVRQYARRADDDRGFPPFPPGADITATETMIAVSAMLAATRLQLFELGMWQSWSGQS